MKTLQSILIKYTLVFFCLLFFVSAIAIFRPVPIVAEKNAISERGIVSYIYEAGIKDVVFRIENTDRKFYINRGLENGLNLEKLREQLVGNEVLMKYPKYWTPLDWNNKIRHISKLEYNGKVLFNELK